MYLLYITCVFRCIAPELKSLALGIQTLVMRTLGIKNIQIMNTLLYLLRQERIKQLTSNSILYCILHWMHIMCKLH